MLAGHLLDDGGVVLGATVVREVIRRTTHGTDDQLELIPSIVPFEHWNATQELSEYHSYRPLGQELTPKKWVYGVYEMLKHHVNGSAVVSLPSEDLRRTIPSSLDIVLRGKQNIVARILKILRMA